MITLLRKIRDGLDERLGDGMDRSAPSSGWTVERTGRFGLSRKYVRQVRPETAYSGDQQVATASLEMAWRDSDSASDPRHSTQGECTPYVYR